MKPIRVIGLTLVAVFAMSAITVSSASAVLPEFTTLKVKLKSKSVAGTTPELKSGAEIVVCTSSESKEAEVTGVKTVEKVVIKFKGCKKGTEKCKSGTVEEEIVTKSLNGTIGYLVKATPTVGTQLKPAAGTEFVKFKCGSGLETTVTGCALGQTTPVNEETTLFKLIYKEVGGAQEFTKFEGGAENECRLTAFGFIGSVEVAESSLEAEAGAKEKITA